MMYLGMVFAALLGLAMGSFLNVCISRLPLHQSVVSPRSRCMACSHPISARDNIPVLSWFILRGKCRHCGTSIPLRYLLVEVGTAVLFVLCYHLFGPEFEGFGAVVFGWLLIGLCAMDAERMLLPDAFTITGIVLGVLVHAVGHAMSPERPVLRMLHTGLHAALWAAAGALLLLLIRWIYAAVRHRTGLGLGDVKLFAMITAWFGVREAALVFFLGVISAAVYGLLRVAVTRAEKPREPVKVPFGSFLCLGALYCIFWGQYTLDWYLKLFR